VVPCSSLMFFYLRIYRSHPTRGSRDCHQQHVDAQIRYPDQTQQDISYFDNRSVSVVRRPAILHCLCVMFLRHVICMFGGCSGWMCPRSRVVPHLSSPLALLGLRTGPWYFGAMELHVLKLKIDSSSRPSSLLSKLSSPCLSCRLCRATHAQC
jgi:hypothetical protein